MSPSRVSVVVLPSSVPIAAAARAVTFASYNGKLYPCAAKLSVKYLFKRVAD